MELATVLDLTSSQLRAISAAFEGAFPGRLRAFLLTHLPSASAHSVDELLPAALDGARAAGLAAEQDIATYAVLFFLYGGAFARAEPWAGPPSPPPGAAASDWIREAYEAAIRHELTKGSALPRRPGAGE